MLIIVEGTDLAGKTTFIEYLRTHLPQLHVLRFKAPKPREDPYVQYEHAVENALLEHEHIVCDRSHWSEPVYAQVFDRKDRLGIAGWRHHELFFAKHNAQVVFLQPSDPELRRRYNSRGDDLVTLDEMIEARLLYEEICFDHTILPMTRVSNGSLAIDRVILERGAIYDQLGPLKEPPDDPCYVGPQRPSVLLVGEKRNSQMDRLAFVPRRATSGRYLLEALPDPFWRTVGLTNACEPDRTSEDLIDIWLAHAAPIVALGQEAHKALEKASIPHSAVPHPQYIRRFHHGKIQAYGRLIERCSIGSRPAEDHLGWKGEDVE